MLRIPVVALVPVVAVLASCSRGPHIDTPTPDERPLAGYVAQRIVVTPAGIARPADSLGWVQRLGGTRAVARMLDTAIAAVLDERGLSQRWVMPPDLARSYDRNRSYATDPYQLALDPLRATSFVASSRFGEPLSSQLRTMIALHNDARYVLIPVELRFEREGGVAATAGTAGRAVLRLTLLDPRFAEARWVGELQGDTSSVPTRALSTVAARVADLFSAP